MKAEALLPHHIQSLTEKDVQDIKEGYRQFINLRDLDVEIERWKFKKFNSDHVSLEECVSYTKGMFPNLHIIFLVLLTLPVSVASAERSFSSLKR